MQRLAELALEIDRAITSGDSTVDCYQGTQVAIDHRSHWNAVARQRAEIGRRRLAIVDLCERPRALRNHHALMLGHRRLPPPSHLLARLLQPLGHRTFQREARGEFKARGCEETHQLMPGPVCLRVQCTHAAAPHCITQLIQERLPDAVFLALRLDTDRIENGNGMLMSKLT